MTAPWWAVGCGVAAAGLATLPRRRDALPSGVRRMRRGVPLPTSEGAGSAEPVGAGRSLPRWAVPVAVAALGAAAVLTVGVVRGTVVGLVAGPALVAGARVLAARPVPIKADRSLALVLDLWAAALRAGQTIPAALTAAAPAARSPALRSALHRAAGLLALGADPASTWAAFADGPLRPVAATAARTATSGVRAAAAFERVAAEVRDSCTAAATARAHRAGITAMGPLAACFLPSFVCLGVVPVVVGIARSSLGVLR